MYESTPEPPISVNAASDALGLYEPAAAIFLALVFQGGCHYLLDFYAALCNSFSG